MVDGSDRPEPDVALERDQERDDDGDSAIGSIGSYEYVCTRKTQLC